MQLEALSEWLQFLTGETGVAEEGDRSVVIYSYGDDAASLVFEKMEERPAAKPRLTKFIIGGPDDENRLYSIIRFLAENDYSFSTIWKRLEAMPIVQQEDADMGTLGSFNVVVMTLGGEE